MKCEVFIMTKRRKCLVSVLLFSVLICLLPTVTVQSAYTDVAPFPIGIFNPPNYANTTFNQYKLIKDMNATFVLLGNDIDTFAKNDAAITQAAANGLQVFANDGRMGWYAPVVSQPASGHGRFVSSGNALGQTFKAPEGMDCAIGYVQLYIDNANWTAGKTLTLSVYDSPGKSRLIGQSAMTGPVGTLYPTFYINKTVTPGSTYYWELTSNSASGIGWVCTTNGVDGYTDGKAYEAGTALNNYDFWFNISFAQRMYNGPSQPSTSLIDEIADHYKTQSSVAGFNIIDEPFANQLTRVFDTVDRFRFKAANKMTFVNLLPEHFKDAAGNSNFGFGTADGEYVSSTKPLGQTFITNGVTNSISTIQLWVDPNTWAANEALTLKLWNAPSKNSLIAQKTIYGGHSTLYPQFTLNAVVTPNTSYYWELVHNGGGDNSVGWVVRSSIGTNWERSGAAYINGVQSDSDFWFTINQNLIATSYEDYVYRWANQRPDFLMYDLYPFLSDGTFRSCYYSNMEVVRRQSLQAGIPFWTYIQSCGIVNDLRTPNANEIRYQVYTSLAYGCKGYSYFLYWTPDASTGIQNGIILPDGTVNTAVYNAVRDTNAEVLKLGPVLKTLTSQAVYHTGTLPALTTAIPSDFFFKPSNTSVPTVMGYLTDGSGRKYIFAVNRDEVNSRTISFNVTPKPSTVKEISKTTGNEADTNYNASTGVLSASFAPGEGRLYVLPAGY